MTCHECELEIQDDIITAKGTIALNKKLLGRGITRFFCAGCLAEYLDIDKNDLPEMAERFKEQGCSLF